jgi:chemotaxis signal transduction protein
MSEQVLVFEVRGVPTKAYAIDVERILNVLEPTQMTKVPLVSTLVRGIVSNRGRIVTVVDAGVLLKVTDGAHAAQNVAQVLVLRDGSRDTGHVGLEVGKIRNLETSATLDDAVTVVDASALQAELEARVSNAIPKEQGVLR